MSFEPGLVVGDTVSFFVNLESMNKKDGDGTDLNPSYGPAIGKVLQITGHEGERTITIGLDEDNKQIAVRQQYYQIDPDALLASLQTSLLHTSSEAVVPKSGPKKIFFDPKPMFKISTDPSNPYHSVEIKEYSSNFLKTMIGVLFKPDDPIVKKIPSASTSSASVSSTSASSATARLNNLMNPNNPFTSSLRPAGGGGSKSRRTRRRRNRRSTRRRRFTRR